MPDSNHHDPQQPQMLRVRGQLRSFLERRHIRRRDYYLLEPIGSPFRKRYLAFDPYQGPGGDYFLVQTWPGGPRAEQKLRVLRGLKADSLLRVVEWQRRNGDIDVVLTWIEGISLAQYLDNIRIGRRPPVDPGEAVRLIYGLANAVCTLHHKHQIAHGDIQPPNVIVTSHPSRLVLIDFGSAWTTEATAGRAEGDGQHRCYAAPELQREEIPVGFLADQFSVSVLFFQLLTQQLPYGGLGGKAGRPEYIGRPQEALRPPSEVAAACRALPRSLREGIDRVALRGLTLAAHKRYPDRHAWLKDLFEVYARFRLAPELSPVESVLTRVLRWIVHPRGVR